MYTDYSGYCYDYDDENNDGSREADPGDGCGSGGTSLSLNGGTTGSASSSGSLNTGSSHPTHFDVGYSSVKTGQSYTTPITPAETYHLQQIINNPMIVTKNITVKQIIPSLSDPRLKILNMGNWAKYQSYYTGVLGTSNIHFIYNSYYNVFGDIKFLARQG